MARPRAEINKNVFESACALQCTEEESGEPNHDLHG